MSETTATTSNSTEYIRGFQDALNIACNIILKAPIHSKGNLRVFLVDQAQVITSLKAITVPSETSDNATQGTVGNTQPVAWFDKDFNNVKWRQGLINADFYDGQPFYTSPQPGLKLKPVYLYWNTDMYPCYWDRCDKPTFDNIKSEDDKWLLFETEDPALIALATQADSV